jgi:hypothetical protein
MLKKHEIKISKDIVRISRENVRREKTMEDVFYRLMVTSDPYIFSIRKLPQKKKLKSLSPEAITFSDPDCNRHGI